MLRFLKILVARVIRGSTQTGWTLFAISFLLSGVVVVIMRCVLGA